MPRSLFIVAILVVCALAVPVSAQIFTFDEFGNGFGSDMFDIAPALV